MNDCGALIVDGGLVNVVTDDIDELTYELPEEYDLGD